MTDPGAPRYGRHSPAGTDAGGNWAPRTGWEAEGPGAALHRYELGRASGGTHRSGLLDPDVTGPLPGAMGHPLGPPPGAPLRARHAARDDDPDRDDDTDRDDPGVTGPLVWPAEGYVPEPGRHPSAPLPPRPPGVWDRLHPRPGAGGPDAGSGAVDEGLADDEAPTEAHPLPGGGPPPAATQREPLQDEPRHDEPPTDAHPVEWPDSTGGLEVLGADVEDRPRRRGRRARPAAAPEEDVLATEQELDLHASDRHAGRRRRRPLVAVLLVVLLVAVAGGVVVGGRQLLGVLFPTAEDFSGTGSGAVEVRVAEGDTLSDIAATLVDGGVIASGEPFVDAAEADAAATSIQPGVYTLRAEMSGQAALDLLLDPASRMLSRVTVPEGLTVEETLQRLADDTGVPLEELQAAAADPAALGLPAYAGSTLEGYLFPATYDFEPDTSAAQMLTAMVAQHTEVTGEVQLEQRAAAAGRTPAEVVVVASMVEAETRLDEERADVAQVIYNRLAQGIPLGIDATLAYGLDKNGNELTVDDLQTDSPYNTRTRPGLPPTPISAPGQASLEAALEPSTGTLLYYVLESEDGSHFFTDDYAEFQEARARCAAAGLGCGG